MSVATVVQEYKELGSYIYVVLLLKLTKVFILFLFTSFFFF